VDFRSNIELRYSGAGAFPRTCPIRTPHKHQRQRSTTTQTVNKIAAANMIIFYSISNNHHKSTSSIISPRILLPLLIGIASAKGFSSHFAQRNPRRSPFIQARSPLIPPASATTIPNTDMSKPNYSWTKPTLELALPALVASIADPLVSMMDTAYIGRLGSDPLAALGVCTSIFYISFYGFLATKTARQHWLHRLHLRKKQSL
jgi:hypothetical protein